MIKDYMAIINLAENENDIRSLTTNRPIASIPIGSRYRVIDFILSNIVNCGIQNVGIFSASNSRSLTDHVGTGKAWDLNRKIDGLFVFNHGLCDFVNHDSKLLKNNMEYIYRSTSDNVILASSYMVCNMDLAEVVHAHEASGADMTVVYKQTDEADEEFLNCYTLDVDEKTNKLLGVGKNIGFSKKANICMEIFLMKKEKLVELIYKSAHNLNSKSFISFIFNELGNLSINTYKYDGIVLCINTISSYYRSNMKMLAPEVSDKLFRSDRPIYTKIKENILYPVFTSMCNAEDSVETLSEENEREGKGYADELMKGIWYSELYKMFFKNVGGFYHNTVAAAIKGCQMILFEAYDGAGYFITSDNPAFENKSVVEVKNTNGMLFPLSPKYLLFIAKGSDGINVVDHRFADSDTIHFFNRIIARYKNETIIALPKNLNESL